MVEKKWERWNKKNYGKSYPAWPDYCEKKILCDQSDLKCTTVAAIHKFIIFSIPVLIWFSFKCAWLDFRMQFRRERKIEEKHTHTFWNAVFTAIEPATDTRSHTDFATLTGDYFKYDRVFHSESRLSLLVAILYFFYSIWQTNMEGASLFPQSLCAREINTVFFSSSVPIIA